MMFRVSFLLLFWTCLTSWETDYASALQKAQKEDRPLLVAVLGSDWCPWSKKFADEVLGQKEFLEAIEGSMAAVRLEYSEQPELREKLRIEHVPTLVVMNAAGEEIARFGYLPFTPRECASHLVKAVEAHKRLSCASIVALSAEGLRQAYEEASSHHLNALKDKFLQAGLEKDRGSYFKIRAYAQTAKSDRKKAKKIRQEILSNDPDNRQGSQLEIALADFQHLAEEEAELQKTIRPLKRYLKGFGKQDSANAWRVHMILAQYLFTHGKVADALKHGKEGLAKAPEEAKEDVRQTLSYFGAAQ